MDVSAEPTSFDAVAARLDRGGSLYLYLSTEQWMRAMSEQLGMWREMLRTATARTQDPAEQEAMMRTFDMAHSLVKKSGLEMVTGVGASSFALEKGVYRNKLFIHHHPGKGDGLMWSTFGKEPHPLSALDLLPADTAVATFMDLDIAQLIGSLREEVERSGPPEAKQALQQGLLQFTAMFGMTLEEFLQSLGGAAGLVITLDPANPITFPVGEKTESIPAPRLAIVFKVKNDRVFQWADKTFGANPMVIRVDEPTLRMRTMVVPALPQMPVRATVAQWGDYLVIASDDKLVRDMMAAQTGGKGFRSTPEFASLSKGLPDVGNGFQLSTQRFADTWNRFQGELMKNQPGLTPDQSAMIQKLWGSQKSGPSYSVTGHVENGWLAVGKGSTGAGQMIVPLMIVPVAIAAGVAMPVFGKVQDKGKATKSMSNAKQIAVACRLFAVDNNGKFPATLDELIPDYLVDRSLFTSPFAPTEPMGYSYVPGLTDTSPPETELIEDKFSVGSGQRIVVRVDGSAVALPVKK
jgi:hypothetical protein